MKFNAIMSVTVFLICFQVAFLSEYFKPLRFKINIDEDLKPQYEKIYPYYADALKELMESFETIPQFSEFLSVAPQLLSSQPLKFQQEIQILSEITGYPISYITIMNMAYEIFCTSIVVNQNDTVFMARNLDFQPRNKLANITYEYEAYRNGELLYTATNIFGDVGVINVNLIGKFGASIDQRYDDTTSEQKISRTLDGDLHPTYFLREIAENATSYEDAVKKFQEGKLTTPVYYIIGGIKRNQGTVIARNFEADVLVSTIQPGEWFIVETNYDLNQPDPPSDPRRTVATNRLNALGENNTNYQTIVEDVLGLYPNRNQRTVYTSVFSPSQGYYETRVYEHGLGPN